MAHVVTGRCVDCKYTDCCTVCPVDCFYEIDEPKMLVIDPDTCIDCQLCIPECPVHAIYPEDEVPEPYKEWIEKNRELYPTGRQISEKKEPAPDAKTLKEIQEREKERGWDVDEPTGA
jgi:ferredoxin